MNNIWIALSWSAAVAPAWAAVQWVRPRLEPYGQVAELAAFGAAWYLFGSFLSGVTRLVLVMAGVPVGPRSDPAAEIEQTCKLLAAGRVGRAEGELRMAACHIALGRPAEALACCDAADAAEARDSNRGEARFFRGRALEALGRRDEARTLYQSIVRDQSLPRLFRGAACIRAAGLAGAGALLASELDAVLESAEASGCKPCSGGAGGWTADELTYLGETIRETAGTAPAAAAALDVLLARATSGRSRRALRRLKGGLTAARA